jgi:hypothetical protein
MDLILRPPVALARVPYELVVCQPQYFFRFPSKHVERDLRALHRVWHLAQRADDREKGLVRL